VRNFCNLLNYPRSFVEHGWQCSDQVATLGSQQIQERSCSREVLQDVGI